MTTVTNEIIQNQYQKDGTFTLMATPLPTGSFEDNSSYQGTLLYFFPFAMIFMANLGSVYADMSKEQNEDKLVNILKRIGYRPIIEVYRRFYLMLISWIFLIPIALIILVTMLPSVNVVIGLSVILIVITEMTLIDMILKYGFGSRLGMIIKLLYYAAGFFLSLGLTYNP